MPDSESPSADPTLKASSIAPRPRWVSLSRKFILAALGVSIAIGLIVVVASELTGPVSRSKSIAKLKEFARTVKKGESISPEVVEKQLVGWTSKKVGQHERKKMLVYYWGALLSVQKIRVILNRQGNVLYIDSEQDETEDVMQPFVTVNDDGVRVNDTGHDNQQFRPSIAHTNYLFETREAFSAPVIPRHAGIVIFPVTDVHGKILSTGAALSMTAQHSIVATSQRRMLLDPALVRRIFIEARIWESGATLNRDKIDMCLAAIGAPLYVLPSLETLDNQTQLVMELHGSPATKKPRFVHDVSSTKLNLLPGLMALDILEYLQVRLLPEERTVIAAAQFNDDSDAESFVIEASQPARTHSPDDQIHQKLLKTNPGWIAAWDLFLDTDQTIIYTPVRPKTESVLSCATISRYYPAENLGERFTPGLTTERAFYHLLKSAPQFRGEARYHSDLARLAIKMNDQELISEVFAIWEREDSSYPSRVERAKRLSEWFVPLMRQRQGNRAIDDALLVEFQEMFDRVESELSLALTFNPLGWAAHAEYIRLTRMRNMFVVDSASLASAKEHFRDAIRILPESRTAWENQHEFLNTQRLARDNTADLYQFADECLASGLWKIGIPQRLQVILGNLVRPSHSGVDDHSRMHSPEYWPRVDAYWKAVQTQDDVAVRASALNFFAYNAAMTGHFFEAAPAFDQLDRQEILTNSGPDADKYPPGYETLYQKGYFGSDVNYCLLRDRVHAQTRNDATGNLAAIRVALAAGELTDAERMLQTVAPRTDEEQDEVERLGHALELGKRLKKDRRVQLSANDAINLFAEVKRTSIRGIRKTSLWKIEGGNVDYHAPGYHKDSGWISSANVFFPLGLERCTVQGKLQFDGRLENVQILSHPFDLSMPSQLIFDMARGSVFLVRGNYRSESVSSLLKSNAFAIDYAHDCHWFSPLPAIQWDLISKDDSPVLFGFEVSVGTELPGKFSLSDFTLELHE